MEQKVLDILQEFSGKPSKILLVEDAEVYRRVFVEVMKNKFPEAEITATTSDTWLGIEKDIRQKQYDIIFVGGSLRLFEAHPLFKNSGMNIIPFIKRESKNTKIIVISEGTSDNATAMDRGADAAIYKSRMGEI